MYNDLQYTRLVQLAAVLDFKLQGKEFKDNWFKSNKLILEQPFFSDELSKEILFLFAPQQLMRHNVFFDPAELEVL